MELLSFSCTMCGEHHMKYLPSSTNRTTCMKCGNLIELSSQQINRSNHINLSNRLSQKNEI